jgi:hypothetical protein
METIMNNQTWSTSSKLPFFPREWTPYLRFTPGTVTAALAFYLVLVRLLRNRTVTKLQHRFPDRSSYKTMTIAQAQAILNQLGQIEFPFTYGKGIQFALFRTYGIPTISSLLVQTSLFAQFNTASKRYADTAVLVSEIQGRDFGSREWIMATSRMNCIHATYQKAGKISNDDMLYTLALFPCEVKNWIARYEWRELTGPELCALGLFWKAMGDGMGIEFKGLPTYDAGLKWRDGLHFLEELAAWTEEYERSYMVPHEKNFQVAEQTTAILLWLVPGALKGFAKNLVIALMDERLRLAMKYPRAPSWISASVRGIFAIRRFILRHLSLPRPYFARFQFFTKVPSPQGTYFLNEYDSMPYYVKPTLFNRWGPEALIRRAQKLPVPGDDGDRFCPMGYTVRGVGPNHGRKDQEAMEERVARVSSLGLTGFES